MSNRRLTDVENQALAQPLLATVRKELERLSAGDKPLFWALRRKIYKELTYDERGKPTKRRGLKARMRKDQNNQCKKCGGRLPARGAVLDRFKAMDGYNAENTQLLCRKCDTRQQEARRYNDTGT